MWFNTTDHKIAYRKYVASTGNWDTSDTYPFGDLFTSPYYITTSYQVHNNKIPTYWQEGTLAPYNLLFDYFSVDTTAPAVSVLSPENQTYVVSDVALTFTVDESTSWIGYSVDGQANVTTLGNKTLSGLLDGAHNLVVYANDTLGNTTLSGLLDGAHNLVVYANDTAGNMGASSTVYFTVDTVAPNIGFLSPENKTYTSPLTL